MDDARARAIAELADLEALTGFPLGEQPVHETDQWAAAVRDLYASLGADLTDPVQARAAFAGAYTVTSVLLPTGAVYWHSAVVVTHLLRLLAERGDEPQPEPPRRRWWRW